MSIITFRTDKGSEFQLEFNSEQHAKGAPKDAAAKGESVAVVATNDSVKEEVKP